MKSLPSMPMAPKQSSKKVHHLLVFLNLLTFFALLIGGGYIWFEKQQDMNRFSQNLDLQLSELKNQLELISQDWVSSKELLMNINQPKQSEDFMTNSFTLSGYNIKFRAPLQDPNTISYLVSAPSEPHERALIEVYKYEPMPGYHIHKSTIVLINEDDWDDVFQGASELGAWDWNYQKIDQKNGIIIAYKHLDNLGDSIKQPQVPVEIMK